MKRWLAPLVILGAACSRTDAPVCEDDGIFCNGIERLVDAECIKVPQDPTSCASSSSPAACPTTTASTATTPTDNNTAIVPVTIPAE